ncbi:DNA-binding transcriptional LysR family regulator [Clostridium moniliforme]|uniref:DNA-binding transcriptional LysR family regulator n=1 Tax=Clostridium moniliforme TaxID=39489 RepID=A0ABS4F260_9CLOT|nr:LysR family transcriptional regulator [Clostridium moniliforme]MBP1890345.1 DNA-binding transcriptional LysR family regulator [Clostridium moniliforme]
MDFNQLKYFIVTAKIQHITKAAEKLSLSQSALSRSISNLESELGVPLFDRINRNVQLNKFGEIFLDTAIDLVNKLEKSKKHLNNIANPDKGEIIVSFVPTLGLQYIPKVLKAYKSVYPNNQLYLKESDSKVINDDLIRGTTDIGISPVVKKDPDLIYSPLFTEELVFLISNSNPLAKKDHIDFNDISGETFFHFAKKTYSRDLIENALSSANITLSSYDGLEIASIIGLVEANLGIAIVPKSATAHVENIKTFSLPGSSKK